MTFEIIDTDVLIVGAGGAGCRAAISASNSNQEITIVTKDILGKAHTVMAEGGVNASLGNLDHDDNWEIHARDTCNAGAFLNDQRLVEILAKESSDRVLDLENFGAVFSRTPDGLIMQRPFGHQTYRRTCYAGDRTGHELLSTLTEEIRRRDICIVDEVFATSILRDGRRVVGITAVNIRTGRFSVYRAKAVIMAAGGAGRIFAVTTNAQADVGSGYAMAFKAGVKLVDMEQFQFHPTGAAIPPAARGKLVTEGVRGEGGILLNKHGERFMEKYNPRLMELAGRDEVARSIANEIREGQGTENEAVYLDVSFLPKRIIEERLPTMLEDFLDIGIDIRNEPMEVTPTAHHVMGGLKIDTDASTNITGLYAAGEVAGGVHGGNRLGGNALAAGQVFGKISGESAASFASKAQSPTINRKAVEAEYSRILDPLERDKGLTPAKELQKLQKIMWDNAGIFRNQQDLNAALVFIKEEQKQVSSRLAVKNKASRYNTEWIGALELHDMLIAAEMLIRSAIFREESRGAHYRTDYPSSNHEEWFCNIVIQQQDSQMVLQKVPVTVVKWEPPWIQKIK
jgi:succinate dehydrogenase/fumarate reductase flavoprotein subunit